MNYKTLTVLLAAVAAAPVSAYDGFSPSADGCKGVAKEVKRVGKELSATSSKIQGEWLEKQLQALNSKKSTCETKGFETD